MMRCTAVSPPWPGRPAGRGRGIAGALGEAGATVMCTGRSSVAGPGGSDYDRPETIEETAELVTSLGGTGIAIGVDHLDPEQVRRLAGRVRDEHGRIDVLVNDPNRSGIALPCGHDR